MRAVAERIEEHIWTGDGPLTVSRVTIEHDDGDETWIRLADCPDQPIPPVEAVGAAMAILLAAGTDTGVHVDDDMAPILLAHLRPLLEPCEQVAARVLDEMLNDRLGSEEDPAW